MASKKHPQPSQDIVETAIQEAIATLAVAKNSDEKEYKNDGTDETKPDEVSPWLELQLDRFGIYFSESDLDTTEEACRKIVRTHQLILYRQHQVPRLGGLRKDFEKFSKLAPRFTSTLRKIPKEAYHVLLQSPEQFVPSGEAEADQKISEYYRLLRELGDDQALIASAATENPEYEIFQRVANEVDDLAMFLGAVAAVLDRRKNESARNIAMMFDMSAARRLVHDTYRLFIWSGKLASTTDDGPFDLVLIYLREAATGIEGQSLRKVIKEYVIERKALNEALVQLRFVLHDHGCRQDRDYVAAHDNLMSKRRVISFRKKAKLNPDQYDKELRRVDEVWINYLNAKSNLERGIPLTS